MTVIESIARDTWRNISVNRTAVGEVRVILQNLRTPDMNLVRTVADNAGLSPSTVDLCWTRMIDAILTQGRLP